MDCQGGCFINIVGFPLPLLKSGLARVGNWLGNSVIYAPGVETGYAPTTLPGITEAVRVGNAEEATKYVGITAAAIDEVAKFLEGWTLLWSDDGDMDLHGFSFY